MRVLVVGGAGYIGSFVVQGLIGRGHEAFVLDDLSTGHRESVGEEVEILEGRCGDEEAVAAAMEERGIEAVVHLAALSLVGDSVRQPCHYWRENVGQTAGLLMACERAGVRRFVFSSTAAVYGEPEIVPIEEDHPLRPTNPYGATKLAIEQMLRHMEAAARLGWVSLRYFNAAGACPDGERGEDHDPETHLVPLALKAAARQVGPLTVFGDDYPTADGTCERDYIHVFDLAQAHAQALDWLEANPGGHLVANLGAQERTSVRQMLDAIEAVTGKAVPHKVGARRPGDPAVLVASNARARAELGWVPKRSDIHAIVKDAWAWHSAHPHGYSAGGGGDR